jgi:hypothetical protein
VGTWKIEDVSVLDRDPVTLVLVWEEIDLDPVLLVFDWDRLLLVFDRDPVLLLLDGVLIALDGSSVLLNKFEPEDVNGMGGSGDGITEGPTLLGPLTDKSLLDDSNEPVGVESVGARSTGNG